MPVTNKTSELALIIVNQFESSRLEAEAMDRKLRVHKFTIGTSAPNMIAIQVPEVVQVGDYAGKIYNFVDTMINEAEYEVTEPIAIHLYGRDQAHIVGRTLYPKSKKYVN
jgi:hypothetical protein